MKNLCLLESDLKAKQPQGARKARCDALLRLLYVVDEGSIVRKERFPNQPLRYLGVGLRAPLVEETANWKCPACCDSH